LLVANILLRFAGIADKKTVRLTYFLFILFLFSRAFAFASLDAGIGGAVIQESKTISDQKNSTKNFYEVYGLTQIQKYPIHFGLSYLIVASTNNLTATTTETLYSSNLYFMARFGFFKKEIVSLTLYYNPSVQATYSTTGNASDQWAGAAYALQFLLQPQMTDNFRLNGGVMYFSETYSSKSTTSASSSVTSFTRTTLLPALGMQYSF
jgi:hypothetical protein